MHAPTLLALQSARAVVEATLGCLVLVGEENATALIRRDSDGLPVEGRVLIQPPAPEAGASLSSRGST